LDAAGSNQVLATCLTLAVAMAQPMMYNKSWEKQYTNSDDGSVWKLAGHLLYRVWIIINFCAKLKHYCLIVSWGRGFKIQGLRLRNHFHLNNKVCFIK
jgi:hypothetical protein